MSDVLDDLMYSSEALAARFLLFQGLNDINLIVEDKDREYIYETIFKRMLGEQYHISAIFAAGGKPAVKDRYNEFRSETNGVKNFYIVDGDFDRYIHEDDMINDPCFIYLETYNIENYFIDEEACLQFSKGHLKCLDNVVREKVSFNGWKERIISESTKLFLCYCFVQKFHPETENVSRSSFLFVNDKTGFERNGAYQKYWNEEILTLDSNALEKINEINDKYISINGNDHFNLICGKFLLDSLCAYLRNLFKATFSKDEFKWHLINHFDITKLDYVKNAILQLR
jgi:hypothetical protein